jgi:glyoxylase-like metal-dependent hydrolase (beta-lactamase superfamily II)
MRRSTWVALVSVVAMMACSRPTPERRTVDDTAAALGGRSRILAVKSLVIEGEGTNGNLGQDMTPEASTQAFNVTGYRLAIDVPGRRWRIDQTRTPNFTYFQGPAPQKQVLGIDRDVAYNVAANGTATRLSNAVAKDRRVATYHHPLTIVRAALDPGAKLANARNFGDQRTVDITTADGLSFTLAVNGATGLPTSVVSMADNTNLGDIAQESSFADYQDVNGLKLPSRITTKVDNYQTSQLRITKQTIDAGAGDLAAPAAAASAAAIAGPPPAIVTAEPIARGIWLLAGQTHHSVAVEFADHVLLIEAPQNDTRTLAAIAKARELVPGKPLTAVVNTHHHFDHSGGIRAAVAEGLSVITYKGNAAFFQQIAGRAHTIAPDALANGPKPLKVVVVDDELVLKDKTMAVNLYHIAGSPHADTLLMAYFPAERILVEADVFSPGAAVHPYAANLLENIRKRNLRVDRIVPLHGTPVTFEALRKTQTAN